MTAISLATVWQQQNFHSLKLFGHTLVSMNASLFSIFGGQLKMRTKHQETRRFYPNTLVCHWWLLLAKPKAHMFRTTLRRYWWLSSKTFDSNYRRTRNEGLGLKSSEMRALQMSSGFQKTSLWSLRREDHHLSLTSFRKGLTLFAILKGHSENGWYTHQKWTKKIMTLHNGCFFAFFCWKSLRKCLGTKS